MKYDQKEGKYNDYCQWCNQPTIIVWVHGHGQCSICDTNIEECCRGEICEIPKTPNDSDEKSDNEKQLTN